MNATSYFAGIDVSKVHLDVHLLPSDQAQRFPNSAAGHRDLVEFLRKHGVALIVLESTGGYERAAVVAMLNARLRVHVAQPQVIRAFAVSHKLRAKTDRIDASVLARYAQERGQGLRVEEQIDPTLESLRNLMVRRDELITMQTMEKNRLQQASDKLALQSLKRNLAALKREIARVEKNIDGLIQADEQLRGKAQKLQETKGVGPQTARLLVACLPELGRCDDKRLNALVGVAPYPAESGDRKPCRRIAGGRQLVRDGLYMACMSAMLSNPVLSPFYQQLRQRKLAHKSAMMACIRKLLAHLNKQIRLLIAPVADSHPAEPAAP
jgi:transposase